MDSLTYIIQPPNESSSREQVMNNISILKKFVTENEHIGPNYQDVSFMIGTTAETVFLLLIFAACVVSNSLVFVIFYQKPTFRSLSNRFVLNLAVSNLLYSLLIIPNVIVSVVSDGSAVGLWWCRLTKVITVLLALSSAFSVVLIAVDRYCAVMNPLHYSMTITGTRSTLMIAFVWSLALGLSVLPMARLQDYNNHAILVEKHRDETVDHDSRVPPSTCLCWTTITTLINSYHRLWYSVTVACLGFLLPLLLLCWIYACMYRAAKQNNDRARRHSVTTNPSEIVYQQETLTGNCSMSSGECTPINTNSGVSLQLHSSHMGGFKKTFCRRRSSNASVSVVFFREEGRAAQTGLLVIVAFAFCWFPYFAFIVFEAHPAWIGIPALSRILAQHLTFIGCALNPFVYVYRNRLVWKDARHVLHCSKRHDIPVNNVNINNNHMNHLHRCSQLPIESPLINHHHHQHNVSFQQQQVSRAIHKDFACLHSYPLTNNRLARSLRQAGPKIVCTASSRHRRLLYELPPHQPLENIELDSIKNNKIHLNEPIVVVSNVDECSENVDVVGPPTTVTVSLPIRLHNGTAVVDYLKVESSCNKPNNVIGSSWSLPNHNTFYAADNSSYRDVQTNVEVENGGSYVRLNRDLYKKSTAAGIYKSVLEMGHRNEGMDRNRVYSKSAHFTRNVNNNNNENDHYTMNEMTINKSNLIRMFNINNNHHHLLLPPAAKSTLATTFNQRKRFATMDSESEWSIAAKLHRRANHTRHASAITLLDVTQQPSQMFQGTTI